MNDAHHEPDPLARFIRAAVGTVALRVGAIVGVASVALTGVVVLLLGLIPADQWQNALGTRDPANETDIGTAARVARAFLFPWIYQTDIEAGDFSFGLKTLLPLPTLFLVAVLVVAGLYIRRVVPAVLSDRAIVTVTAAFTAGILLAILAAVLGYHDAEEGFRAEFSFSSATYFLAGLIDSLLIGSFAFGLVVCLRAPVRTAARTAAVLFFGVYLVGVVLFPFFVVTGDSFGDKASQSISNDLADVSAWAPGIASSTLPLALGAPAHLQTEFFSPFQQQGESGTYTYWPELSRYTQQHESAHIAGYSSAGGIGWKLFVLLGAVVLVVVWVLGTLRTVRILGAPRSIDGLWQGALVGAFGFVFLVLVDWLSALKVVAKGEGGGSLHWGMTGGGTTEAAFVLLGASAVVGAVYAAFRPRPYGYERLLRRQYAIPVWLWPGPSAAAAEAPEDAPAVPPRDLPSGGPAPDLGEAGRAAGFCTRCGALVGDPDASFCARCGAPLR